MAGSVVVYDVMTGFCPERGGIADHLHEQATLVGKARKPLWVALLLIGSRHMYSVLLSALLLLATTPHAQLQLPQ
jgi:hypothetical protein